MKQSSDRQSLSKPESLEKEENCGPCCEVTPAWTENWRTPMCILTTEWIRCTVMTSPTWPQEIFFLNMHGKVHWLTLNVTGSNLIFILRSSWFVFTMVTAHWKENLKDPYAAQMIRFRKYPHPQCDPNVPKSFPPQHSGTYLWSQPLMRLKPEKWKPEASLGSVSICYLKIKILKD